MVLGPDLVTRAQTQINQQLSHVLDDLLESSVTQSQQVLQNDNVDNFALVVQLSAQLCFMKR